MEKPRDGDPLVDYFFPTATQRRRWARAWIVRVAVGLAVVALAAVPLFKAFRLADSLYCSWRLRSLLSHHYRAAALHQDLDAMLSAIRTNHPRPNAWRTPAELERETARVERDLVDGTTRLQALRLLAPLVAGMRCGHSRLTLPAGTLGLLARGGRFLPLGIRFVGSRAFVVQHYGRVPDVPLGSEVISMNGLDVAEIRARLLASLSSDGPGDAYASFRINQLFFFYYWTLVDQSKTFRVRCRVTGNGPVVERVVASRPALQVAESCFRQNPGTDPRRPLFPIEGHVADSGRVAYLRVPTFGVGAARGYAEALHDFFANVKKAGAENLVIDVRGNGGGPSVIAVELLRYLVAEPFVFLAEPADPSVASLPVFRAYARLLRPHRSPHFDGSLYCLIDGGSFSTTGHFIAALKAHREVVLVGEESGGGASCTDNGTVVELPHTGLRLRVARTVFRVPVDGADAAGGIAPDVTIHASVEDLVAGRDPMLAWIDGTLGSHLEPTVPAEAPGERADTGR